MLLGRLLMLRGCFLMLPNAVGMFSNLVGRCLMLLVCFLMLRNVVGMWPNDVGALRNIV